MAHDILAIPISTVAVESAFSTSGRVLDQYRSSLHPRTVEALVCGQDWLRNNIKGDKKTSDLQDSNLALGSILTDEEKNEDWYSIFLLVYFIVLLHLKMSELVEAKPVDHFSINEWMCNCCNRIQTTE